MGQEGRSKGSIFAGGGLGSGRFKQENPWEKLVRIWVGETVRNQTNSFSQGNTRIIEEAGELFMRTRGLDISSKMEKTDPFCRGPSWVCLGRRN